MTRYILALFIALFALTAAQAAPTTVTIGWNNPTTSVDGVPLTGANALTGITAFCATATIADIAPNAADPFPPSATFVPVGVAQTGVVSGLNANPGDTIFCRLRSVRGPERSAFSVQGSKLIPPLSTTPNPPDAPSIIKIDITINGVTKSISFP